MPTAGGLSRPRSWVRALAVTCAFFTAAAAATSEASAATIAVTTTQDEMTAGDHLCSLREAIGTLNAVPGNGDCGAPGPTTTIVLKARTYFLAREPEGPNGNDTGDLNLTSTAATTIAGAGPAKTRIDANVDDRVLSVGSATHFTLARLTISGGRAADGAPGAPGPPNGTAGPGADGASGGGIANAGSLTLRFVRITGNRAGNGGAGGGGGTNAPGGAGGSGGGIANTGTLTVEDSAISDNLAGHGGRGGETFSVISGSGGPGGEGGYGGGIFNGGGTTTLRRSLISYNVAGSGGTGGHGGVSPGSPGRSGGVGGDGGPGGGVAFGALEAINSTVAGNLAGSGGGGGNGSDSSRSGDPQPGGNGGNGGHAGSAGGYGTVSASAHLRNVTLSGNAVGSPGAGGGVGLGTDGGQPGTAGSPGVSASGGAIASIFADITLTNSIVASNAGGACYGGAIHHGGHNLVFPADPDCTFGLDANPLLKSLGSYGGPTETMALKPGSPAINKVPAGASCPPTDQRRVRRPHGPACEIGAFEFALPVITISRPPDGANYKQGAKVHASFACREAGGAALISSCVGTVENGKLINTSTRGKKTFRVTAVDRAGNRATKTVHYTVG